MRTSVLSLFLLLTCLFNASAAPRTIHLFVALCDNQSQGIAPVPAKIGNGNDPDSNLYWGCSDGAKSYFSNSSKWKRLAVIKPKDKESPILERIIFQHKESQSLLVADAYQGSAIKTCIKDYLNACLGGFEASVEHASLDKKLAIGAKSNLVAYIGHNGLMDFQLDITTAEKPPVILTITLCCHSESYFSKYFRQGNVYSLLQTKSLMYPGAFILHDALEGLFKSNNEKEIRMRAVNAYARNQKISVKAAGTIFSPAK
ncbi:hypothetical protein Rhal01_02391 [Rubritalea halochordaticola]|uniref:Uncharacterized protein n=1 Tax=Rubritalea halochordaticola TaxID=714537 RepID=A0ABP9V2R1_9BACT